MARQKPTIKSRRQLLAENRELKTRLEHKNITVGNLETQVREANAKVERAERNVGESIQANGRIERSLGVKDGIIRALEDELFMTLRASMRKDGMAFEDIERIITERQQPRRDQGDGGDFGPMRERRPGERRY